MLEQVDGPLALQQVDVCAPGEGEILVRMRGVGICHTDISAAHGVIPIPLPAVLGHEGSGVVQAVGPGVDALAVGDHVALSFDNCVRVPTMLGRSPGVLRAVRSAELLRHAARWLGHDASR